MAYQTIKSCGVILEARVAKKKMALENKAAASKRKRNALRRINNKQMTGKRRAAVAGGDGYLIEE